ncbi:MAG: Crp/Fnr family transcriptional regulator [Parvularculaceae bacterium]
MALGVNEAERTYIAQVLSNASLFAGVSGDDLRELTRCARLASFQRTRPLAPPRGKSAEVYVICSGVVAALTAGDGGADAMLTMLYGPDDTVGLGASPRDGGAFMALVDTSVVALPRSEFNRVRRRSPELCDAVYASLTREIDLVSTKLGELLSRSLEARLAGFYARIADLVASNHWEPRVQIGRITQTQTAHLLGVTREHVNRTLMMWERSGLVFQAKGGDLIIENRKRLAILADERAATRHAAEGDRLWEIDSYLDKGLNQMAYNLAIEAARRSPKDKRFPHRAVLATARSGALEEALALIDAYKLADDYSDEEIACLRPRLLRDIAFSYPGDALEENLLGKAAQEFSKVFDNTGGFYAGLNAAATYAMLGEEQTAADLAHKAERLALDCLNEIDVDEPSYWVRATVAECRLIAGDLAAASADFANACRASDVTPGKKATTRKQLRRLARSLPIDSAWIDEAAPQKGVLFYAGPLAPTDKSGSEIFDAMRRAVRSYVKTNRIGNAFGALASGTDIVIAEELLDAGIALNIYLPLPPTEFVENSIARSGADWEKRFIACVDRAQTFAWNRRAAPSHAAFQLGAVAAMGKALRYAEDIDARAHGFFAYQQGRTAEQSVSKANECLWRARGHESMSFEAQWPASADAARSSEQEKTVFACIFDRSMSAHERAAIFGAGDVTIVEDSDITAGLFAEPARAVDAATRGGASPSFAGARCWLDAGAFTPGGREWAGAFIAATCRPATPSPSIYASEVFALSCATLGEDRFRFEYAGFIPGQEKLEPCPLYLMV